MQYISSVYAIKHAKDVGDMKAISQNLMHVNIYITNGIYGGLSDSDVKTKISHLGAKIEEVKSSKADVIIQLLKIIEQLKNGEN